MPGEISRSNPGPSGNTPYVPSWICDEEPSHEFDNSGQACRWCWMPIARWKKSLKNPCNCGANMFNPPRCVCVWRNEPKAAGEAK